jgi:hypothetical protein
VTVACPETCDCEQLSLANQNQALSAAVATGLTGPGSAAMPESGKSPASCE